jgi:hypothetical protein
MNGKFYDKVARKFGSYSRSIATLDEYSTQDPEKVFKEMLIKIGGKNKRISRCKICDINKQWNFCASSMLLGVER